MVNESSIKNAKNARNFQNAKDAKNAQNTKIAKDIKNTKDTKKQILQILRSSNDFISGENLANLIGVSRVAIWKAIKTLQENDYKIISEKNGYLLLNDNSDSDGA